MYTCNRRSLVRPRETDSILSFSYNFTSYCSGHLPPPFPPPAHPIIHLSPLFPLLGFYRHTKVRHFVHQLHSVMVLILNKLFKSVKPLCLSSFLNSILGSIYSNSGIDNKIKKPYLYAYEEIYSPGTKKKWSIPRIVAFVYATFSLTLWALKISCYVLLPNRTLGYTNLVALRFPPANSNTERSLFHFVKQFLLWLFSSFCTWSPEFT